MHLTCIMLRIINLGAGILMMFFESNLKIEHFTEKNEIFTEILLKKLKRFNVGGGGWAPSPPPEPPTR